MQEKSLKNIIFSGMIWKFGERILAQGISFVVSVLLSRLLLPEEFGLVALVLIFISIADVFVTSGFSTALVQNKNADSVDFSTNFYCSLVISLILYGILYIAAPVIADFYHQPELIAVLRVFSLRIPLSSYSSIQHAYVERYMLFRRYFFSTLFGTLISGVVGVLMAYYKFGVWALIAQYFTNTIVDILVLSITVPWHPEPLFSFSSAKRMMNYSWKILAADLSGTFFDQLRSLLVGRVYTSADLAFYNKGKQMPDLISVNVSASIMTVLFPAIANINDDISQVKAMTRRATETMAYIMFPLLFGVAAAAKPLILLLYTDKWSECIAYVQILSISSAVSLVSSVSLQTMKAIGRSDILLLLELWKKPVYLLFLITGIYISVPAVAVTMLLYSCYSLIINAGYLKKLIDYTYGQQIKDLSNPIVLSVSMGLIVWGLSFLPIPSMIMLILQVTIGAGYYIITSKLTHSSSYEYLWNFLKEKRHKKTADTT